ncbi:hypothetical protein HPB47_002766, partial [Ixodes persulcatus]
MKISRSYTPVIPALKADQGRSDGKTVHLMIKAYPEGALTPVLKALQIGDTVEMKDTEGDFEMALLHKCHTLVLLAAGTGFTPMVRLLHWALFVSKQVDVKLMTFNKTVKDIIWKEELDHLLQEHNRLRVEHVLSEPDDSWEGARGRVRSHLLQGFVPSEDPRQPLLICVCGPLPFTKAALNLTRPGPGPTGLRSNWARPGPDPAAGACTQTWPRPGHASLSKHRQNWLEKARIDALGLVIKYLLHDEFTAFANCASARARNRSSSEGYEVVYVTL